MGNPQNCEMPLHGKQKLPSNCVSGQEKHLKKLKIFSVFFVVVVVFEKVLIFIQLV